VEASSAPRRAGYLDPSRLSPGEFLGMGAAVVLFASLWLPWFTTSADNPNSRLAGASGGDGANAWQVFDTLDLLLVLAATAPFILSWIIARGHRLTWVDIGLGIGYFLALIGSAGMLVAGYLRQAVYGDARKPPGTI
jgi:hypothetical protein